MLVITHDGTVWFLTHKHDDRRGEIVDGADDDDDDDDLDEYGCYVKTIIIMGDYDWLW